MGVKSEQRISKEEDIPDHGYVETNETSLSTREIKMQMQMITIKTTKNDEDEQANGLRSTHRPI